MNGSTKTHLLTYQTIKYYKNMAKETPITFEAPKVRGEVTKIVNPDVELKDLMTTVETYMPRVGEKYTFPETDEFYTYTPQGFTAKMVLMAAFVERNGKPAKPTWLNITPLKRVDADRNPVYPAFAELPNASAIAAKLHELGSLTAVSEKQVITNVYEGNSRKYETVDDNGKLVSKPVTRNQSCVVFAEIQ